MIGGGGGGGGVLDRLVQNSRTAIRDGVYDDVAEDGGERPAADLPGVIRSSPHAVLITEIKFASPSAGRIRTASDPAVIAGEMVAGGARALSVLTQPHLFGGSPGYFAAVRGAVDVPLLMKDVVIDRVQVDAGVRMGADYILLIQSLFEREVCADGLDGMIRYCHEAGLGVLLEVHTAQEMRGALGTDADMIGINNRNLDTLEVDLGTTKRVLADVAAGGKRPGGVGPGGEAGRPIVSESGIGTPEDVRYLHGCGADAFLVGSGVMRSGDVRGVVRGMVNAY